VQEGYTRTSLSPELIDGLVSAPDGDARLAREILRALRDAPSISEDLYLAVVSHAETQFDAATVRSVNGTFPLARLTRARFIRRPDFGEADLVAVAAGLAIRTEYGSWLIGYSGGDAQSRTLRLHIRPDLLALVIVGAWLLWLVSAGLVHGVPRARARRRLARGLCPDCRYQLLIGPG
jgi:hypothetical protein